MQALGISKYVRNNNCYLIPHKLDSAMNTECFSPCGQITGDMRWNGIHNLQLTDADSFNGFQVIRLWWTVWGVVLTLSWQKTRNFSATWLSVRVLLSIWIATLTIWISSPWEHNCNQTYRLLLIDSHWSIIQNELWYFLCLKPPWPGFKSYLGRQVIGHANLWLFSINLFTIFVFFSA